MIGELYDYNGKKMSVSSIAKLEGLHPESLRNAIKKCNNISDAVALARNNKESHNGNIFYKGKLMTVTGIAKQEGLKIQTLVRYYRESGDIEKSVEKAKKNMLKYKGSVLHKGKISTFSSIAKENDITVKSLIIHYNQCGNIDEAIRISKEMKKGKPQLIDYKGRKLYIKNIADIEEINSVTLKKYYDLYNDIDKAVFISKYIQLKNKQIILNGKKVTFNEIFSMSGLSPIKLEFLLRENKLEPTINRIVNNCDTHNDRLTIGNESLYKYCLRNSYNYAVILRMIRVYDKEPEEAVKLYLENGQKIPVSWIYEKYNVLFKHFLLNYGIDSSKIVKVMKDDNIDIKDAITKVIFFSNNNGYTRTEIEWLYELYLYINDLPNNEYELIKKKFFIDERDENLLKNKDIEIKNILRQILYFEFSEIIDVWSDDEILNMMRLYRITDEEKKIIIMDLYSPYKDKVIDPTNDYKIKRERIRELTLNFSFSNETIIHDNTISDEDKEEILKKRELLNRLKCNRLIK